METLNVDLWAANLQVQVSSLDEWLSVVEERVAIAAGRGAQILMMPEFACAAWLAFAPSDLAANRHLEYLESLTGPALEGLGKLARHYGVAILPGTFPIPAKEGEEGAYHNRAYFLTPEGAVYHQDKMSLTPLEADGASGVTVAGRSINIFVWRDMRIAMPICLDAEYTALWALLGKADLDLVLIPAKTDMITGYSRVFGCAHARAIELQTVVCVVGAVGAPLTPLALDSGVGGAAVYVPCDVTVCAGGIWANLMAQTAQQGSDLTLHAPSIPIGAARAVRRGSAEAELRPASWSADHIEISEPEAA
ncbi:MAG: hypothetical protein P1U53_02090 [Sulfitobacter sp.]|nr:hypothetical protein [Sulfitobacter sp.]